MGSHQPTLLQDILDHQQPRGNVMHPHRFNLYKIVVNDICQDYLQANGHPQLRPVRESHSHRIAVGSLRLRAFIRAVLIAAGEHLRQGRVAEPADTA